ncbi:MAG: FemAB family XrtA/PEP-CTERM system-associated protein [Nitrospirota bacterium]|nr:FemAB family XrtA/PEP-CTERM system-associated protein [Nitrospirota bacterium]
MSVNLCPPSEENNKRWDDFVAQNTNTGHCHLSGWQYVISKSYGHQPLYLWDENDGIINGILPLISMQNLRFSRSFVSLPFLDDGGICANEQTVKEGLYKKALALADEAQVASLDFRHRHASGLDLPAHGEKVTLVLKLVKDPDLLWKGFNAKLRNQIRKPQKSGLTASWHGLEGLKDFYDVFAINMQALGSPVHGLKFFAEILKTFKESAKIILVKKEGKTIGGGICLYFKDTVQIPWASSLKSHIKLCPNNLLYWETIRWASEAGYERFDFGRSSPGSGTYRFKTQWGAEVEPLHWGYYSKKGDHKGAMIHSDDARYNLVTQTWRKLPLPLTKLIGPFIRRRLSN